VVTGRTRSRLAARFGSGVVAAAIVVTGFAALAATSSAGQLIHAAWTQFPGDLGFRGLALVVLLLGSGAGVIMVVRRLSIARLDRLSPWVPMAMLIGLRVLVIPLVETPIPPGGDPIILHQLAVGVLDGGNPVVAHRPMGFSTLLAGLYALFGVRPWLAEVLNLAFAILAGWMLYQLVLAGWGARRASIALVLYAIAPSPILMVTTVFTETVYSGLLLAALALTSAAVHGRRLAVAIAGGIMLAAAQYVRPMSQAFLPVLAAAPFLSGIRLARAGVIAAALIMSFIVALLPVAVHNLSVNDSLSLSTSSYGGWSLFVGANQEHDGRINADDQATLRSMEGSWWERSAELGRAGVERIVDDPGGFLALAVRKFHVLWSSESYAVGAALRGSDAGQTIRSALELVTQLAYVALAITAVVGLWRMRRAPPLEGVLMAAILVVVAVSHTFLEVQGRYNAYLIPLICALAAVALHRGGDPREV
jgi:hypothetical protein